MSAFVAVAEHASFAKAARQLGVSRSTLSTTIRGLEEQLGVRLLNRTTRSVSLTEIGERFLGELRPALDGLDAAMEAINVYRDRPTGHLRLTVPRPAAKQLIEPILSRYLSENPGVTLELVVDSALTDIVRNRFDAGIRPGHRIEQDMIAVRVGEDARPVIVASPDYLVAHGRPKVPADLQSHNCFRQRFASGVLHRWSFEKRGKTLEVAVTGTLITSESDLAVRAALDGLGIARVPRVYVQSQISEKRLISLLEDWMPQSVGFFLYYPSRRQMPAALREFIDLLKEEGRATASDRLATRR